MSYEIEEIPLHETAQERYLNYAMSVITSRALPDVRDGLKPVQRRILYTMFHELRLSHDQKHRKSAAIVGDAMGKYHPHGDQSIYDAMVRMAQSFNLRYPLVDGQGNFGSIDGDSAAAMRYTEARLAPLADELLAEIRKKTVAYRPNYDATLFEPVVLPAQVPNLLINGATGIAVGMATNIPPHNLGEVVDALVALIDRPSMDVEALVDGYINGPDFPTGGVLLESPSEIKKIYNEGSGTFTLRADWELETDGAKKQIIVTSVPFTINKSSVVEKIAEHIISGKLPQLIDVRDESTEDVRIVLELKKGASHAAAMAYIFKHTPLQHRFHTNLTCLVPTDNPQVCSPARLDLKSMLQYFLEFRMEVVTKRTEFDLAQLLRRIHLLEGFEIIFDSLDEAIAIIRASDGKKDAREKLIERFELDQEQTDAILDTRLYRIAKLEIKEIRDELAVRRSEASKLESLLASESKRWTMIKRELRAIRSAYGDTRRTRADVDVRQFEYSEENYIIDEEVRVILTRDGWFKRQKSYSDLSTIRVRDGDEVRYVLPGTTRGVAIFFSNVGRAYTMRVDDIPSTSGYGDPIQASFDFSDGERIVGMMTDHAEVLARYEASVPENQLALIASANDVPPSVHMVAVSEGGLAIRFALDVYEEPSNVRGRAFMKVDEGEHVVNVEPSRGDELVSLASRDGRGLTFKVDEISTFKGVAKGVKAIALEGKDTVLDFTLAATNSEGLDVETNRGARQVVRASLSKFAPTSRGNIGRWIIKRGHLIRSHRMAVEIVPTEEGAEEE